MEALGLSWGGGGSRAEASSLWLGVEALGLKLWDVRLGRVEGG